MAANEFERAVQKVMDEFHLHPSEEVWQNVEQRIKEKKRKRRILFILAFSLLGLGLAGFMYVNLHQEKNATLQDVVGDNPSKEIKNEKGKNEQASKPSESSVSKTFPVAMKNNKGKNKSVIIVPTANHSQLPGKNKKSNIKKAINLSENSVVINSHLPLKSGNDKNESPGKIVVAKNAGHVDARRAERKSDSTNPGGDKLVSKLPETNATKDLARRDSSSIIAIDADTAAGVASRMPISKNDSSQHIAANAIIKPPALKKQKHRDIQWGLQFSGGFSDITAGRLFSQSGAGRNAPFSPGSTGIGYPPVTNPESANDGAFAFKVGLTANKGISRRSSLSAGINYAYLADKIKIGTKQASTLTLNSTLDISSYYGSTRQETFTDRFHFLELPILYQWRLTRNSNQFLGLDAGLSLGYLLATNGLVYDTAALGIYYHDRKSFTHASLNFLTGISYHMQSNGRSISFGPQFSFGLNKMIKPDLDRRKYPFYAGIGATVLFGKK